MMANNAAIAPLGEAKPNTEIFRLLAAAMGFDEDCFKDSDELAAVAFKRDDPRSAGYDWEQLKQKGWQRLTCRWRRLPKAGLPRPRASASSIPGR
jgi:anaerobic selenocysteine-containing dehydrogenase